MSREPSDRSSFFRPIIDRMQGYAPGAWPAIESGVLKLNSNENPYPPSDKVLQVLADITSELLRRYPDPLATDFRHVVAETFNIPSDWIIVGNGSDDLLTLLIRACAESQRTVAYPMPTYVLYRTLADIQAAQVIEIPYVVEKDDWHLPVQEILSEQAAITFVATPNSPTGHIVSRPDLKSLAQGLDGVLVIDEAYVDFEGDDSDQRSIELVKEFENVMLLRTLSKGYALAGLRLGFGIAQPRLLSGLLKVKDSYNVDAIALRLGKAAIADRAYKQAIARKVVTAREDLAVALREIGFFVWRSHANFLLTQPPGKHPKETSQKISETLKEQQIMIRYFSHPGLDDKLRITVGTPQQNAQLISAIRNAL